jgi:hypothetical protein
MSKSNVLQESARPLEGTTNVKPLQVAVGQNHTLLLLPSPLLLLPEAKKGGSSEGSCFRSLHLHLALISLSFSCGKADVDEEVVEQPCLDPRIGEMVRSLNLGKEGEKLFLEANISYEVLQHLTKDDLQVRLSRAFDLCSSHGPLAHLSH